MAVVVDVIAPDRIELTDSISIRVSAWDPNAAAAIARVGFGAVIRDLETGVELARAAEQNVAVAPGDTVSVAFSVHPNWLAPADLPAAFVLELSGWAVNTAGRCAAAIPGEAVTFACQTAQVDNTTLTLSGARAPEIQITAVLGRTTPFPTSTIVVGDLQVDTLRSRAYLSNRLSNRLHVFNPTTFDWEGDVMVGSEPWGCT